MTAHRRDFFALAIYDLCRGKRVATTREPGFRPGPREQRGEQTAASQWPDPPGRRQPDVGEAGNQQRRLPRPDHELQVRPSARQAERSVREELAP